MEGSLVKSDTVVTTGANVGVVGAEVVNAEVVEDIVRGSIQFMLPSPDESVRILQTSITNIQNTLSIHTGFHQSIFDQLGVMNTTLFQEMSDKSVSTMDNEIVKMLQDISTKMDAIAGVFASLPEWIPAHALQKSTGLSVDAIRKQLLNPKNFEPEIDYIQIGKIWHINKNAIPKVRRQK